MHRKLLHRSQSGWQNTAIKPSPSLYGGNLVYKHPARSKKCHALSHTGVQTQKVLCSFFHEERKPFRKNSDLSLHPIMLRCSSSCKHISAVAKVPAQKSSTSSFALENLYARSVIYSTELCSAFRSTLLPQATVDLLKTCSSAATQRILFIASDHHSWFVAIFTCSF